MLVRVSHCGVCHSDFSLVNGTFPVTAPTILGHEAAGVVEAVGDGVTTLRPGDKVVLTPLAACDRCYWCLRGEYGCCVNAMAVSLGTFVDGRTPLSRHGTPVLRGVGLGGFAEYAITTASGAVKVADDVPLDVACVIGCAVQTGVGAVLHTAHVPGARIAAAPDALALRVRTLHRAWNRAAPAPIELPSETDWRGHCLGWRDGRSCLDEGPG